MQTIEELKKQKAELERQIKALESKSLIEVEGACLDQERYPENSRDQRKAFFVRVELVRSSEYMRHRFQRQYSKIIKSYDRSEVVGELEVMIRRLQDLYKKILEADVKKSKEETNR